MIINDVRARNGPLAGGRGPRLSVPAPTVPNVGIDCEGV